MPRNADDVETFLYRLNRNFDGSDGMFVVSSGSNTPPIAISVHDPIVVVRVDIGKLPENETAQNALYRQLLVYNGIDLIHAAYAIEEDGEIVLTAGLALENLDMNELAAVLADVDLALARHVAPLRKLAQGL